MAQLRVKEFATKRRISQADLHRMTGLSLPLIGRYWNNKVDRITFDAVERLAKALEVQPASLIDWKAKTPDITQGEASEQEE
jgi:DNA-binding Xre family transcriptional regulator